MNGNWSFHQTMWLILYTPPIYLMTPNLKTVVLAFGCRVPRGDTRVHIDWQKCTNKLQAMCFIGQFIHPLSDIKKTDKSHRGLICCVVSQMAIVARGEKDTEVFRIVLCCLLPVWLLLPAVVCFWNLGDHFSCLPISVRHGPT